jgi:hypothetical protein
VTRRDLRIISRLLTCLGVLALLGLFAGFGLGRFSSGKMGYVWLGIRLPAPIGQLLFSSSLTLLVVGPPLLILGLIGEWAFRERKRAGHCPACNYDLRATPDRCPECGTIVPP